MKNWENHEIAIVRKEMEGILDVMSGFRAIIHV